jgi:hypothetical protein
MKTHIFLSSLFCLLGLGHWENKEVNFPLNNQLIGSWKSEGIQIQYVVDSHLVHEEEISAEKGKGYDFDDRTVRVKYPDGTTAQGTYSLVKEAEEKKLLVLHLPGTTTTYMLISVTPTHMVWQKDLDNVNYTEDLTQKSAERAIYTEVFKKVNTKQME